MKFAHTARPRSSAKPAAVNFWTVRHLRKAEIAAGVIFRQAELDDSVLKYCKKQGVDLDNVEGSILHKAISLSVTRGKAKMGRERRLAAYWKALETKGRKGRLAGAQKAHKTIRCSPIVEEEKEGRRL